MEARKLQFLKAVLGDDGAKALARAAERAPELDHALLPRTIMAWLGVAARNDFEGTIPGVENTYLQFSKAESRYSGSVSVGDEVYSFEAATVLHLGACMAVALGSDHERMSPGLRDLDIQRLGKNIDTLVKARIAVAELRKMKPLNKAFASAAFKGKDGSVVHTGSLHDIDKLPSGFEIHEEGYVDHDGKFLNRQQAAERAKATTAKAEKSPQGGAEAPGPAHAATPPLQPLAPDAPQPTQTSKGPIVSLRPKPPKLPTPKASTDQIQTGTGSGAPKAPKAKAPSLKVTKAQAENHCPVCDGRQFKDQAFSGCICFRDLSKSVKTTVLEDGYNLEFKGDWDQESILTLIESLGRK